MLPNSRGRNARLAASRGAFELFWRLACHSRQMGRERMVVAAVGERFGEVRISFELPLRAFNGAEPEKYDRENSSGMLKRIDFEAFSSFLKLV